MTGRAPTFGSATGRPPRAGAEGYDARTRAKISAVGVPGGSVP
jgi:hypothetical protein